jgi:putative ABC transport system permease protein
VSEAVVALYGAAPGSTLALPLPDGRRVDVFVRAVWRDYARQYGAIVLDRADWLRLTGDERVNDLAVWLAPGAGTATVEAALRALATASGYDAALLEFASPREIRATSLRIFDRSFAVTYWLQAVAIAIGLFGIAASFSAQVLARRKELGLLAHLGLTRRQIVAVVAAEGAVWTAVGAALGLVLGIAVSVVLVDVVNPQSFHWTMDLLLPEGRLAALCAAVVVAGALTAWLSARRVAGRDMVLAVKEDW